MQKWEVMKAHAEGKKIQSIRYDRDSWAGYDKWHDISNPLWDWRTYDYRVKPEPKLRPWTVDELPPVGTAVRGAGTKPIVRTILMKVCDSVYLSDNSDTGSYRVTPFDLKISYEYSTDGEKTWHPCGVYEECNE